MRDKFEIRPAKKSELGTVLEIDARGFGPGHGYNWLSLRQVYDAAPEYFLVALRQEKVIGYIAAITGADKESAWIVVLVVDLPERGSGIAWELYRQLAARLRANGIKAAFLTAREQTARVYSRFGYFVVGEESDYFGPGERRFLMKSNL